MGLPGSVLDGENLFHDALANSVHSLVKVYGAVVITDGEFNLVADLHRRARIHEVDGGVFGVQGPEAQPPMPLTEGKPRSPLIALTPASTTMRSPSVLLTTVASTLNVGRKSGAKGAYPVSISMKDPA